MHLRFRMNRCVSEAILCLSSSSRVGVIVRATLGVILLALWLWTFSTWRSCAHDLQLNLWLGALPWINMMALLAALTSIAGLFAYSQYIVVCRKYQRNLKRYQSHHQEVEYQCYFSLRTLRALLTFTILLSVTATAIGGIVVRCGRQLPSALAPTAAGGHCGVNGTSKQIERVHQELADFHANCLHTPGHVGKLVHECPGFVQAFPQPAPFAKYLWVLEETMDCVGFCHLAPRALFVHRRSRDARELPAAGAAEFLGLASDPMVSQTAEPGSMRGRHTCGTRVGHHLRSWSLRIGMPALVLGPLCVCVALALLCYDDL